MIRWIVELDSQLDFAIYELLEKDAPGKLIMLALCATAFLLWGLNVGHNADRSGKIWFLTIISIIIAINLKDPFILMVGPAFVGFLGFLWEVTKPYRAQKEALRMRTKEQNTIHRREIEKIKASQTPMPQETQKYSTTLKSIAVQVTVMVSVFIFTKVFLGHGTTDATAAGVLSAAVIGVVFKGTA